MSNSLPLPNLNDAIAGAGGKVTKAWSYWFQGFSAPPAAIDSGPWGASPLRFTAPVDGSFLIESGTVTGAGLLRGGTTVVLPTQGFVPMTKGDEIVITWTVLPLMNFIPA